MKIKQKKKVFWRCRYCHYEVSELEYKTSQYRYCNTCGAHFNHFTSQISMTTQQQCKHPKGFEQNSLEADEPRCPDCKLTLSHLNK